MSTLTTLTQYSDQTHNKATKTNKRHTDLKWRYKAVPIYGKYDCLCKISRKLPKEQKAKRTPWANKWAQTFTITGEKKKKKTEMLRCKSTHIECMLKTTQHWWKKSKI